MKPPSSPDAPETVPVPVPVYRPRSTAEAYLLMWLRLTPQVIASPGVASVASAGRSTVAPIPRGPATVLRAVPA